MKHILEARQINELVHFTHVKNLVSILDRGLLPVSELDEHNFGYYYNDEHRYDKCTNAVCTSIEFPNYKMFWPLHKFDPNWIVIKLDASIICDYDCAFCITNAGSALSYNIPLGLRKGKIAFLKLFDEVHPVYTREEMNIPTYYPTDPQAEVLIFGCIPTNYINCIIFKDFDVYNNYKTTIPSYIQAYVDLDIFEGRSDHKFWSK